jgi:hypothetical protein
MCDDPVNASIDERPAWDSWTLISASIPDLQVKVLNFPVVDRAYDARPCRLGK